MAVATSTLIAGGLAGGMLLHAATRKAPKMPELSAIPEPPTPLRSDMGEVARTRMRMKRRTANSGRSRTLLTGPAGLTDEPQAERKTLLGS
jgi:hypothetical protein